MPGIVIAVSFESPRWTPGITAREAVAWVYSSGWRGPALRLGTQEARVSCSADVRAIHGDGNGNRDGRACASCAPVLLGPMASL
jgi:hypothetical protein